MVQATQQYTPAQILEAARRAEAQGQAEYAIQFYRHLLDHHPTSAEATAARDSLGRLSPGEPPPAPRNGTGRPLDVPRDEPGRREFEPQSRAPERRPAPPPRRTSDYLPPRGELDLPPPVRGFLPGRLVAWVFVAVGSLLTIAGGVVIALAILTGTVPGLPTVAPPAAIGAGGLLIGLFLLFSGQVALAIFASANASRDSALVMRTIAGDIARRRW